MILWAIFCVLVPSIGMSELASFSESSRQTALQRFQLLRAHLEDGRSGREAAKKRGVRFGRPRKLALDQNELARRLVSEGKSVREIASVFNVHPATIYRLRAVGD